MSANSYRNERVYEKNATAIVVVALTLSFGVRAYASDQAQTVIKSEENSTSIGVEDITPMVTANYSGQVRKVIEGEVLESYHFPAQLALPRNAGCGEF